MNHYSNPTANAAIGTVDKEIKRMRKYAAWLRKRKKLGLLTPQQEAAARKQFVGIYRRFRPAFFNSNQQESGANIAPDSAFLN